MIRLFQIRVYWTDIFEDGDNGDEQLCFVTKNISMNQCLSFLLKMSKAVPAVWKRDDRISLPTPAEGD